MARRTVVVGGGAGGIGAAGAVKAVDKANEVLAFTEYEDAAYSPCGIPYVHGKEIPDFESLFLATKQAYVEAGIDIHYQTEVTAIDTAAHTVTIEGQAPVHWDTLVVATGFDTPIQGYPAASLLGCTT